MEGIQLYDNSIPDSPSELQEGTSVQVPKFPIAWMTTDFIGTARLATRVNPGICQVDFTLQDLDVCGLMHKYPTHQTIEFFSAPLLAANPKLLAKLVRFDCSRRLMECAKPGRKPQTGLICLSSQRMQRTTKQVRETMTVVRRAEEVQS